MPQHRMHVPEPAELHAYACVVHCSALWQDPEHAMQCSAARVCMTAHHLQKQHCESSCTVLNQHGPCSGALTICSAVEPFTRLKALQAN